MSFISHLNGTNTPNFLESEVGLVLKTYQVNESLGTVEGTRKFVPAGTLIEGKGILFEAVDVTTGDMPGSVMVAGRILKDRVAGATATAAEALGIVVVDTPETTR